MITRTFDNAKTEIFANSGNEFQLSNSIQINYGTVQDLISFPNWQFMLHNHFYHKHSICLSTKIIYKRLILKTEIRIICLSIECIVSVRISSLGNRRRKLAHLIPIKRQHKLPTEIQIFITQCLREQNIL